MVLSWQVSSNTSPRVISMYIDIDTYVRLSVNPPACLPERATKRKKERKKSNSWRIGRWKARNRQWNTPYEVS